MKKLSLLGLVCIIILAMVFCSVQSVPANQAATAQSQHLFDQPDMDLTRDFALLDGTLFYSTADGIYKTSLQQPDPVDISWQEEQSRYENHWLSSPRRV